MARPMENALSFQQATDSSHTSHPTTVDPPHAGRTNAHQSRTQLGRATAGGEIQVRRARGAQSHAADTASPLPVPHWDTRGHVASFLSPTESKAASVLRAAGAWQLPSRYALAIACLILLVVASTDYLTGFELQFSVFYLVSTAIASWYQGWTIGAAFSCISVALSFSGDAATGLQQSTAFVTLWNVLISLSIHAAMVISVTRIRTIQQSLEVRVAERTSKLVDAIKRKEELERMLMDVSEKEQNRIGNDLHDSLCQHLTGVALAAKVVSERLLARDSAEAKDMERIVAMVEEAIDTTRQVAKGLSPTDIDSHGLMGALRELVRSTNAKGAARCILDLPGIVLLNDRETTINLFRIAQEGVRNALRHSGGDLIIVRLLQNSDFIELQIEDNGKGMNERDLSNAGMGMHIMRYRASTIGARMSISSGPNGSRLRIRVSDFEKRSKGRLLLP